jgi:ABC-2 type transport system permease protein
MSSVARATTPSVATMTPAARRAHSRPAAALHDGLVLAGRCVRLSSRNLEALLTALLLPIMLMLMFVYLFGGAIQTGGDYVTYVVPGVLLLCAGFGSAVTAVSVCDDLSGGIIDRLRSLDVSGAALLSGHVAASVARNSVSTLLVLGVAFLIGFRPSAGALDWLAAGGVLLLFILTMTWLSAVIGLVAKSPEAANGFTFFVMFLPYVSSAFVPLNTMPSWIRGAAAHQPVTPVIETLRALLLGRQVGNHAWWALGWCGGILLVAMALSNVLFRRRTT